MKAVVLTKGKIAIVDDDDFEEISKNRWQYMDGYAFRSAYGPNKYKKTLLMHRVIAKTPEGMQTDHKNHDKLDNRKENLRVCSPLQNSANKRKSKRNTTGHKGIHFDKWRNKWRAHIGVNNTSKIIGYFSTKEAAAAAYDKKAKELWGEFAKTNY